MPAIKRIIPMVFFVFALISFVASMIIPIRKGISRLGIIVIMMFIIGAATIFITQSLLIVIYYLNVLKNQGWIAKYLSGSDVLLLIKMRGFKND